MLQNRREPRFSNLCIILFLTTMLPFTIQADSIRFSEVMKQSGIKQIGQSWGISWGDFNADGHPDFWSSNHFANDSIHVNLGDGTFRDQTRYILPPNTLGGDTHGGSWGDFDNDGAQDLLILSGGTNWQSPELGHANKLLQNRGSDMVDIAECSNMTISRLRGRTPSWIDIDRDGRLDMLMTARAMENDPLPPSIYIQTDQGFEEASSRIGFTPESDAQIPHAALADLTGDGILEIIYRGASLTIYDPATLPMRDITALVLPNHTEIFGRAEDTDMAVADFDNNLKMDLFITHKRKTDLFLLNSGTALELRELEIQGMEPESRYQGRSVVAGDFDNDMDIDLYIVVSEQRKNLPNILLENLSNMTFRIVPDAGGAAGTLLGRGDSVAMADYDNDGFLDLLVVNGDWPKLSRDNAPYQLFRNLGNDNTWLQIELEGTTSNRDAIGAQVYVTAGGRTQLREQNGGMHNKSQNHTRIHFGLAQQDRVEELRIRWPSGIEQVMSDIPANQIIRVIEPDRASTQ